MNVLTKLLGREPNRRSRFHTYRNELCLPPVDMLLSLGTTCWRHLTQRLPAVPWYCLPAVRYLRRSLRDAKVFEFSSGMLTLWYASRSQLLVSVEHDRAWFERVRTRVGARSNVRMILAQDTDEYVKTIASYPKESFDLVAVDGRARRDCVAAAIPYVKPGGLLLLDNSDAPEYRDADRLLRESFPASAIRVFRGYPLGSFHPTETVIARVGPAPVD